MKVLRLFSRVSPTSSPYVQFTQGFKSVDSIPLPYLDLFRGENSISRYYKYISLCREKVKKEQSNIIHCHNLYLMPAAIIAKKTSAADVSVVLTLHTSYSLLSLRNKIILWVAFLFLDSIVACGEAVRGSMPAAFSRSSKCVVIRNAVNLEKLKNQLGRLAADQVARPGPAFYMASRLVPGKNVEALISAFKEIASRLPFSTLDIFGDGPLFADLKEKTEGLTDITLRGQVERDALYTDIASLDVYISLSGGEGLPVAPMEALAAGLQAVLSDIPPHRELEALFPERVHILASDLSNIDMITARVCEGLGAPAEISEETERRFGLGAMESEYLNLYERGTSKLKTVFNNKATKYENHYRENINRYSVEKLNRLNIAIDTICALGPDNFSVLDMGCGTGILFSKLRPVTTRFRYCGVDTSPGMLNVARNSNASTQSQTCRFSDGSGALEIDAFDFVVSLGVVGYQDDQVAFLDMLACKMKRSGRSYMIITVGNGESLLRRMRDFIVSSMLGNKSGYMSTPAKVIDDLCRRHRLHKIRETHLLPAKFYNKPIYEGQNAIIRSLYLTKMYVFSNADA